jgi:hypothetical protein
VRTFSCDNCGGVLFYENVTCLACGQTVGFRPDELAMCTTAAAGVSALQPCRNWTEHGACNWFTPGGTAPEARNAAPPSAAAAAAEYCLSCSLNEVVPDLTDARRRQLWIDTERAKRRLIFTLLELGLPLLGVGEKQAVRFRLLADERVDTGAVDPPAEEPIYTGHVAGCLTLNVVEADDAHRESMRARLNERYRTMLGHLRHEIGHYYWYVLVDGTPLQSAFRELFGDETADYADSMRRHYESGPSENWPQAHVSPYSSMHPFEDFAETWAHYIHILDTLETASASAVALAGRTLVSPLPLSAERPFRSVLEDWTPLTVCLNQLNRSMGLPDAYPFVLTDRVVEKLAFVHEVCLHATLGSPRVAPSPALATGAPQRVH